MQVILRENVDHLGQRGEVVKVADGFARNFLIPKRLAYRFTDGVRKQVEAESRAKTSRAARDRDNADAVASRIGSLGVLRIRRKAGESGSLFGSVTNIDLAAELAARGVDVDRRSIRLETPLKRIGTHRTIVHLHSDIEAELVIEIEPEPADAS